MIPRSSAPISDRGKSVLELREVVCCYGKVTAVKGVSLTVGRGQLVALIGANGAGKTTILKAISGLLTAASGSIVFDGADITHASARRILSLGLAHCPEGRHVFPHMTVAENLEMGCYLRSDRAEIAADLARIFDQFPRLAERRQQSAGTLSGGEQQMLAIGRCLMSEPELIMFDEPSLGLAPLAVQEVLHTIRALNGRGLTILLVEQNVAVSLKISNRAYVLENGRIVMSGPGEQLLYDDRVRQAYLGL
jgi:branched-chain amino acid transport system ATP-binding protein